MKSLPLQPPGLSARAKEGEAASELALGHRLRALREQRRLTLDQISQATGLSKGFISRVERDLTSPSVSTLVKMCQALGISAGEVLDAPASHQVLFADAPVVDLGGEGITERLLTPPHQRGLQIIHAEIAPGGQGEEELYTMDCAAEALHVVSGEFVLVTVKKEYHLHRGDTVTFPGAEAHTWFNPRADLPCEVLWILTRYPAH